MILRKKPLPDKKTDFNALYEAKQGGK